MGNRRKSREIALQVLYQIEMLGESSRHLLFWKGKEIEDEVRTFAMELVDGTTEHLKEIDDLIEKQSTHWRLARMAVVDRNILRLAVYELLYGREIPVSVTLNEAIEIAKKFGTEESGSFINGVLDQIAKGESPKGKKE
ncbi:MAG: transcription antitermination factor NusB [Deltaproteobacteria bacterium]|nr:transcription antitermination factor NusB [Deltaproteobacteria bacterium]